MEKKIPFESRNSQPTEMLFKHENSHEQKKLLTGQRSSSMIWSGNETVKINPNKKSAMLEARDKINKTLQERKQKNLFGHIEDVQQADEGSDDDVPRQPFSKISTRSMGQRRSTLAANPIRNNFTKSGS
jgi:hypothetical protein